MIRKVKLALLAISILIVALIAATVVFWDLMAWVLTALYVFAGALALLLGTGFGVYIFVRRGRL